MSSPGLTLNLTCGKGVTECQNLANLCLSSFAESNHMQQKDFDVSPNHLAIFVTTLEPYLPPDGAHPEYTCVSSLCQRHAMF